MSSPSRMITYHKWEQSGRPAPNAHLMDLDVCVCVVINLDELHFSLCCDDLLGAWIHFLSWRCGCQGFDSPALVMLIAVLSLTEREWKL